MDLARRMLARRDLLSGSAVIAGGVALSGLVKIRPGRAAAGSTLKVAYSKGTVANSSFYYLSQHAEKFGLNVEPFFFDRYQEALIGLQTGQLQVAALGVSNYATIIEQKLTNVRIIAGGDRSPKERTVLRSGDINVKNWKDYEGLKLGVPSNSIGEHTFRVDALEHGFDISKVQLVNMLPGPGALIAMKQKEIDGLIGWEPWIAQTILSGVGHPPELNRDYNSIGAITGIVGVSQPFAAANRPVVEQFVKSLVQTYEYINSNPEDHVKILDAFVGVKPEVARKAMENVQNRPYDANIYLKNARALMAYLHTRGLTKIDLSESLADIIDYSYLQTATGKSRDALGYA